MENDIFLLGVFDMFHIGHLNLLKRARQLGELNVGVVRDEAVRKVKGPDKPILDEYIRLEIVKEMKCVNQAILLDDFKIPDTIVNNSDFIIKGEDQDHVDFSNVPASKIIILPRTKGISTSDIIRKIRNE